MHLIEDSGVKRHYKQFWINLLQLIISGARLKLFDDKVHISSFYRLIKDLIQLGKDGCF